MKKKMLLIFMMVFLVLVGCGEEKLKTSSKKLVEKNLILEIREIYADGTVDYVSEKNEYDKKGRLTKKVEYSLNENNKSYKYKTIIYDYEKNSKIMIYHPKKDYFVAEEIFDKEGRLISYKKYNKKFTIEERKIEYYPDGKKKYYLGTSAPIYGSGHEEEKYNERGDKTYYKSRIGGTATISKFLYTYNGKYKKRVEKIVTKEGVEGEYLKFITISDYDDYGNVLKETERYEGEVIKDYKYYYNNKKDLIKKEYYTKKETASGEIESSEEYTYDYRYENDKVIEKKTYKNGELIYLEEYKFDDKDREIYSSKISIEYKEEKGYRDENNEIKIKVINFDKAMKSGEKTETKYLDNGRKSIEETIIKRNRKIKIKYFEYDKDGNLEIEIEKDGEGKTTCYTKENFEDEKKIEYLRIRYKEEKEIYRNHVRKEYDKNGIKIKGYKNGKLSILYDEYGNMIKWFNQNNTDIEYRYKYKKIFIEEEVNE